LAREPNGDLDTLAAIGGAGRARLLPSGELQLSGVICNLGLGGRLALPVKRVGDAALQELDEVLVEFRLRPRVVADGFPGVIEGLGVIAYVTGEIAAARVEPLQHA